MLLVEVLGSLLLSGGSGIESLNGRVFLSLYLGNTVFMDNRFPARCLRRSFGAP